MDCDTQKSIIDLTEKDEEIKRSAGNNTSVEYYLSQADYENTNPIQDPQNFKPTSLPTTIYAAVVDETTGCHSETVNFSIAITELPDLNFNQRLEDLIICVEPQTGAALEGEIPIVLETGIDPNQYDIEWSRDGEILSETGSSLEVLQAGKYQVKIISVQNLSTCSTTSSVEITESSAPLFEVNNIGEGSIRIENVKGYGEYEFSVNNSPFRQLTTTSLIFENLNGGIASIVGRDQNGCGELIKEILILNFPKFFTPNNDGQNDYWNIPALRNQQGVKIYIFDRFGKLLSSFSASSRGWNGTYNGKQMPSDDYWFMVEYLNEKGNPKKIKRNFTLIR